MVRITKSMQAKHFETLSPYLKEFRTSACSISLPLLPQHLSSFPTRWPFPRGDLYHWISLLNRFDVILENFCRTYKLEDGPQTMDFGCKVLRESGENHDTPSLAELGYGDDGDRQLVESILNFSRMLLQNCGNRSLYSSSSHLNSLLNSTSLSLLEATLSLGSELAQRYQAAFKRQVISSRQTSNPQLLKIHYNIDLGRVQQLAMPFTKTITVTAESAQPTTPVTPTVKGKEKAYFSIPTSQKSSTTTVCASDLVSMVKGGSGVSTKTNSPRSIRKGAHNSSSHAVTSWEEWGDVKVTYYPKSARETDQAGNSSTSRSSDAVTSNNPTTPTPIRRSSNLGPHGHRPNKGSSSDESPTMPRSSGFPTGESPRPNFKTIEITSSKLKTSGVHSLLEENLAGLPQDLQYELLTKLRVAAALTTSLETRRQILAIRLLAITNLSYIHVEPAFIEKVLKQDSDEPRRLQLVYQLAELVHPPVEGDIAVPRPLQTIAFSTLDALSQHQTKYNDVCAALSTNVNHGVLLYVVRKAAAEMGEEEDAGDKMTEADEWREALFSLLANISIMPRTGGELITAGLMPILVEVLGLRTTIAERYHPKVLSFLDNIMYSARDAFQTLVNADGLDAVSNLIVYEVSHASDLAAQGKGMRPEYRSASVDYEIPYFQQQTLKWLFKFIHHMMTTAGGYGGNFDRLLRNLIDSSQLLGSLREIIGNARRFGSVVWTNAVSILNDFINNEPTSFAVIAEAGLSRALLEAVTCSPISMPSDSKKTGQRAEQSTDQPADDESSAAPPSDDDDDEDDGDDGDDDSDDEYRPAPRRPTKAMLQAPREGPLARGILPTSDTINIIPQAFGAICLNNNGMKMFQSSKALESFFEIFESPEHVKCMDSNKDLPSNLGSTFDELVRHHPPLKTAIMNAILDMVARVGYLCKTKAEANKLGAVLRTYDPSGKPVVADAAIKASRPSKGKEKAADDGGDVEMQDVDTAVTEDTPAQPENPPNAPPMTAYVAAVATFLSAMFSNTSVRSDFCSRGGIEYVLDLAESPCLTYDFADGSASRVLQSVIALLAEQKPHLTMPSLLQRAQSAVDVLAPFANYQESGPFFKPFVNREAQQSAEIELLANGTGFVKALVNIHSLVSALRACFQTWAFNHRSASNGFNQLNLGDYYVRLVKSLGPLLGASFREEFELNKVVPDYYKSAARVKDSAFDDPVFAELLGGPEVPSPVAEPSNAEPGSAEQPAGNTATSAAANPPVSSDNKPKSMTKAERDGPEFKNFQALQYLLSKMSDTISPFFQILGKGLVNKRGGTDGFQKQSHAAIADALAETILRELAPRGQESSIENISHWIGMLHVLKDILVDVSRHNERPIQTITIVLQAFKDRGGFETTNHILEVFASEIRSRNIATDTIDLDKAADETVRFEMAVVGIKDILSLYSQVVSGKNVIESPQTISMASREARDRSRPEYFSPPQFLVELRMAVLPVVRRLWESDLVEKAPSEISERLIEVIRTISNADSEANALKRSDKAGPVVKGPRKTFRISQEHVSTLMDHDYDTDLAHEALYRCNNNLTYSLEYCSEINQEENRRRNPIPEGDIAPSPEPNTSSRPRTVDSTGTATPDDHAMSMHDGLENVPSIIDSLNQQMLPPAAPGDGLVTSQNVDQILSQVVPGFESRRNATAPSSGTPRASPSSAPSQSTPVEESQAKPVTVDDLNDERAAIRDNLIDKCLDVINAHGGVTFEVADLITTVVNKSPDPSSQRKVVGQTLVIALMSFAGEDDLRTSGKKIAAYAHLLALLLRDKLFYAAAVGELKENLSTLLGFVKLSPNHSSDEPSPWIAHILLIVEMLLSEDARPRKTKWNAPKDENDTIEPPVLESVELVVSPDERLQLLESILDIMPRVGKDEALALAILRILVILTRTRSLAQIIGEKKNIQRLFVTAKQLAGVSSARIQSPLMLILRHIIEDDETIKQIMRSEIKSFFEQNRQQRSIDVHTYLRGLAPTAIRAPELFVEITNEMVKFYRWSFNNPEMSNRSNTLVLKDQFTNGFDSAAKASEDAVQPTVQATEDLSLQDVKPSTEDVDRQMPDASKAAPPEQKLPVVENPDGVIHFLLCELLNYKDVEDKEPAPVPTGPTPTDKANPSTNGDVTMAGTSSAPSTETAAAKEAKSLKSPNKQEFKAEEHPIYIYRCFLLKCLTELLSSYNRTKVEFINFKRSAPPQAMTPSKPRSSVLHYLLNDLIPCGTLDSPESSVALRRKTTTSSWADSVIVALLTKTGEQFVDKSRDPSDGEDEPDLLFVRRFVLENILKAYKEASTSNEALDTKYSRMLSLAVLMLHIMNGKDNIGGPDTALANRSQQQLRRIMFEKGFIAALTASIADIDLNFPGAKEAVRQILKPLKVLTNTAVQLSELSLISGTQGQTEEDEIESATSVSDLEDEREETPDLFRNSTLGMFEPDREEDTSSESDDDDEEMYDDGYGDEMEYEEEMAEDEEDNISEEDEDIEGMGHIEGLSGDHGMDVEVIMEEDDDDDEDEDGSSGEDDEHDSEDDDARVEIIDEAGNIQELGEDDDLEEWESDEGDDDGEDEEDYEGEAQDQDEIHMHEGLDVSDMVGGPLGDLVRALGGGEDAVDMIEQMEEQMEADGIDPGDVEERMGGDYMDEGDDDEDDDDEDDMDEEDMFLEQGYPGGGPPVGFEWEGEVDPPMIISHRGNRPRHAFAPPFPLFPGGNRGDPLGVPEFRPSYRSHRPPQPRSIDDGTNPLLQRNSSSRGSRDGSNRPPSMDMGNWIQAMAPPPGSTDLMDLARLGGPFGERPSSAALLELLRSLPQLPGTIARNGGVGLSFHIHAGPGQEIPAGLRAFIGGPRGSRFESRRSEVVEAGNAAFFTPQSTPARWSEEAKLLFGPNHHEKAADLRSAIEAVLVPPAIEADKARKIAEAERIRKLEEEAKKKAEEERLAKEAKEEEERIEKEKKEAEEREAAERAAAEALAARGSMDNEAGEGNEPTAEAMDGVETQAQPTTETEEAHEAPAEDRPRVTTIIRGNPFDITDLGIDADFLAELPEEIREEVIMTAVAERRSQAAATGAQPSEIDQEFLDALPEDIRDEIIQQERQDRRRREREEQRRQAAAAGGGPAAGDMDAASILATLPPALRQQVLMEQDEEMLSLLPQELADQARAAQRDHPAHGRIPSGLARRNAPIGGIDANQSHGSQRPPRRAIVQMLDKSGIATLLRLMFTLQPDHLKTALWSVLENICLNRQNRTEVVSTILHILQDGSADMSAVERSFAQLSLRAKQPKEKDPKTPQTLKKTGPSTPGGITGITSLMQANSEASPLLVVQQCLGTLHNLVSRNLHIPAFFLTEHDSVVGLKRTLSRKGKGKENKAAKYAINSLLNLLDRDLIMENSTVMELLSGLLNQITQPLQALQRKQKETEAQKTEAAAPTSETAASITTPEVTAATEQPSEQQAEPTQPAANTEGGEASTTDVAKAETAPKEPEKKQRPITPPVIPEQNLKLVINIFVARECSSRTFRETLSTIKNLSAIPGAKAVFGRELVSKAQGLGETILQDLNELLPQIQKATTGTEIQGVALAKFSPGGSEQGKLLRVLTALDHLFDPKRDKKEKPDEDGESSQLIEKQDLLSSLYENSTFGPMWEKLSACLSAIRQRDHMLNVATILLPLIESLMVVCKNTTLKEAPIARSQIGKEMMLTSPPPESRMESLFFTFTEEHRKILNDLVRNSPKLMSGTFSLLVKNPKVLEFDNKRNYFSRSIHTKSSTTRQSYPPLQLSVRRDQVFHDSFKALYFQTADQMKFGKLSIRFHGEEGVDAGGVTREWFQVLSRQMFDPGYALFIPVSSDRTTFHPNQLSGVNEEHLMFFKFIGRIIGKALYEGRVLDCHFSRAVYKRILGKAVSVKDMESLDPDYYKSLVWMLENDITDIITETFSVDNDKFGVVETIDFIPNGRNIAVTEENKHEYVRLMVEWRLTGSVKEQLDEFLKGFHDIIPAELIAIFNEQELELLISGLPEIDVDDWKSNTEYHNYSASSPQIQWFWRAVRSFDKEERAKLLQFVTGTSKVPLNGFKELEGMNGFSRFNIHRDYGRKERLPSSHTCFNQLDLPEYESYEVLRQQVLTAITAGSQYFGFA